jgi:hypothetical protein
MNKKKDYLIAGVAGIASAFLYVLSIIGLQYYISANLENVSAFTQNMNDSHGMMLLYGWPGIIATLLIVPLIYILYKTNKSSVFISKMFYTTTLIGLCFILVGYLFHLALTYFYAPAFQQLDAAQQSNFGAVFKTTIGLQDMFWLSGDLFSFLSIACLMFLGLKEDVFPR